MTFTKQLDDDLYLRLIDYYDAEALFQLIDQSRDYLRQWLSWVDDTKTVSDTRNLPIECRKLPIECPKLPIGQS